MIFTLFFSIEITEHFLSLFSNNIIFGKKAWSTFCLNKSK